MSRSTFLGIIEVRCSDVGVAAGIGEDVKHIKAPLWILLFFLTTACTIGIIGVAFPEAKRRFCGRFASCFASSNYIRYNLFEVCPGVVEFVVEGG